MKIDYDTQWKTIITDLFDDFIEFYGDVNDGYFDTQLYDEPLHQINPYFSSFEDKGTYFLVADPAANGLRIESVDNDSGNGTLPIDNFEYESILDLPLNFNYGRRKVLESNGFNSNVIIDAPEFAEGEGFGSGTIFYLEVAGTLYNFRNFEVPTPNFTINGEATVNLRIVGKNESSFLNYDKDFTISVNDKVYIESYADSEERRVGKECRSRWSPYH